MPAVQSQGGEEPIQVESVARIGASGAEAAPVKAAPSLDASSKAELGKLQSPEPSAAMESLLCEASVCRWMTISTLYRHASHHRTYLANANVQCAGWNTSCSENTEHPQLSVGKSLNQLQIQCHAGGRPQIQGGAGQSDRDGRLGSGKGCCS